MSKAPQSTGADRAVDSREAFAQYQSSEESLPQGLRTLPQDAMTPASLRTKIIQNRERLAHLDRQTQSSIQHTLQQYHQLRQSGDLPKEMEAE